MSDIIYTPPASGGGGGTTINPTNNFIPVRSNATTFLNSILYNDSTNHLLYATNNINSPQGLLLDNLNNNFNFGELSGNYQGYTQFVIDYGYTKIYDPYQGVSFFEILNNFSNSIETKLIIDADNQVIKTNNDNSDSGFLLNFANRNFVFGDTDTNFNGCNFVVDDAASQIYTKKYSEFKGLKFDFGNKTYSFGDFDSVNNNTYLIIDDDNTKITFNTEFLNFNGASLIDGTTVTPVGRNLLVTINGNQYHIPLYN